MSDDAPKDMRLYVPITWVFPLMRLSVEVNSKGLHIDKLKQYLADVAGGMYDLAETEFKPLCTRPTVDDVVAESLSRATTLRRIAMKCTNCAYSHVLFTQHPCNKCAINPDAFGGTESRWEPQEEHLDEEVPAKRYSDEEVKEAYEAAAKNPSCSTCSWHMEHGWEDTCRRCENHEYWNWNHSMPKEG